MNTPHEGCRPVQSRIESKMKPPLGSKTCPGLKASRGGADCFLVHHSAARVGPKAEPWAGAGVGLFR